MRGMRACGVPGAALMGSNGVEDTMPGYYNFKYLASAIAVANSYGRQKVIKIVWPEEVQP